MRLIKKTLLFAFVFVFTFSFSGFSVQARAHTDDDVLKPTVMILADAYEVDSFLVSIGVPEAILCAIPEMQRQMIFESLQYTNAVFASYGLTTFVEAEDGEMVAISDMSIRYDDVFVPFIGTIPNGDLTLSIAAFRLGTGVNGWPRYQFFPSFVWNRNATLTGGVGNDAFAVVLNGHDWEVDFTTPRNLRLVSHVNNNITFTSNLGPDTPCFNGVIFRMPRNTNQSNLLSEGHAGFVALRRSNVAHTAVIMEYIHDASVSPLSVSFSVSLGVFSVSVSSSSSALRRMHRSLHL